ncbi:MAG: lamin tail domain-containing protein [Candidatus Berkelbacteria bacterium]|nr:lamin tail domain-containing protein [Candidatus Berkelbacteria bacterium]
MKNLSKKLLIFSLSIVMSLPLAAFLGDTRLAKAANSAPVMIDEVMPNPSSGNEWVELFNQTNSTIDLSGWTLTELSSPDSNPKENLLQTLVGQIPARGLVTFDIHSAKLNNDGDSIGLYQGTMSMGTLIDRVSYGSVATPYNQSTVAAAPVQGETIAYQFETGNWLTNSSPSKNWFNDSLLNFTSIASDLSSQGISTNLASFPDPSNVSGLYFLSAGKSEIIFDQTPLNLNNLDLFCNLVGVIGLNSGQVVISNKNEIMSQIGASIYMYNLDFADGTLPVILIDGRLAKAGEILSENYSGGTLNFVVPKINFSTLDLDLGDGNTVPVNLIEADQSEVLIQNLAYNITSPNGFSYPLLGDQKSGYRIFTDRQPNNVYKIQFAGSTSEKTFDTLDGDYFGLYVTESNVDAATLNNYFAARADLTQSFKDYYRDVVAGKQPLLYLYQQVDGQVKLADAASRDILGRNVDFFINADFPISKINLFGHVEADSQNYAVNFNLTIHGVDQNKPTVTLKITDGNGITDQINQTLSIGGIDESGIVSMRFSNDEINYSTWENFAPSKNWQISDGFGRKSIYLQLEDSFGNISDPIIARTIFRTPEQLSLDSDLTLTATSQEVLVGNNFNNNSVVNVPLGIQNGILNFWPTMDTLGVATVPGNIEINSATSDGNITLELPKGTKISGPTGWSGDINLPQIVSISNLEVVGDAGFFPTIKNSFTVGLSDSSLIFDHALRLKLSMANLFQSRRDVVPTRKR